MSDERGTPEATITIVVECEHELSFASAFPDWKPGDPIPTADDVADDRSERASAAAVDLTPDGWMVSDPYTHLTCCPTCWAQIDADVAEKAQG